MASPKHSANRRKFSREPLDIDDLMSASSFSGIRDVIESRFGKPDAPAATPVLETDPTRLQYVWEPKEAPISLRLGVDLIERLEKESLEIFRAITNRGSEIGGILLGQVVPGAPLTVVVEDYEPVPCAYSLGPTYRLSEEEQQNLREMIARRRATGNLTVGFFRSNTRPTLALTEEDLALFHGFFPEDRNVFLLAKPFSRKPCQGAVFVREGRKIQSESSYLEFPFSKSELEKSGALQPAIRVVRQTEPAGPASEGDRVAITPPAAAPRKPVPRAAAAALDGRSEPPPPVSVPLEPSPAPASASSEPVRSETETGMTAKVEARVETADEPKIELKIEPRIEPKIEPGPPPAAEAKIEPQVPASPVAESEPVLPRVEPAPLPRPRDQVQPQTKSEWKVVAPAPPPIEVSVTSEPAAALAAPRERRRWLLGVAAVAVIGGIGLLAVFWSGRSAPSAAPTPASAVRPEQAMLALRVEGAESGLMIQWDPLAPAISAARGGRLTITEGGVASRFNLSADDLKTGRYIYKPRADNLTIRLELDSQPPGQNVFGLTGVVGATRMLLPASRR
jgi:hypothetical protein